jgi:hypothetical protein
VVLKNFTVPLMVAMMWFLVEGSVPKRSERFLPATCRAGYTNVRK